MKGEGRSPVWGCPLDLELWKSGESLRPWEPAWGSGGEGRQGKGRSI